MDIPGFNSIRRLLGMRGIKRLEVCNELTDLILGYNYQEETPGIKLRFLETKKYESDGGTWTNYNILLEAEKYSDTPRYLSYVLDSVSKIIKALEDRSEYIDSLGIQEVDTGEAGFYYILLYILGDGREKENECEEQQ